MCQCDGKYNHTHRVFFFFFQSGTRYKHNTTLKKIYKTPPNVFQFRSARWIDKSLTSYNYHRISTCCCQCAFPVYDIYTRPCTGLNCENRWDNSQTTSWIKKRPLISDGCCLQLGAGSWIIPTGVSAASPAVKHSLHGWFSSSHLWTPLGCTRGLNAIVGNQKY